MNQVELAQHLSKCTGIAGSVCGAVMGELFSLVRGAIERNETVTIKGFGTFVPEASKDGYEIRFEAERPAKVKPVESGDDGVIQVTETRKLKLDSERMTTLKMLEEAQLASEAEEAIEATEDDLSVTGNPPPDKPGYKIPTRSGLNPAARSGVNPGTVSPFASSAARSGVNRATEGEKEDKASKSGRRSAARSGRNKAATAPVEVPDGLSSFASDILGLDQAEVERGLGLAAGVNPISHGRRLTFPVQINRQAVDASSKRYRPSGGEERRQFKDLALKNFFLSLGSIVRDRDSHEPLIVFDVEAKSGKEGERYVIKLLQVSGKAKTNKKASTRVVENPHELRYEEKEFDFNQHEVLIVIDEKMGPRIHGFDIGSFKDNDRRERAEICLAQEYENYQVDRK